MASDSKCLSRLYSELRKADAFEVLERKIWSAQV